MKYVSHSIEETQKIADDFVSSWSYDHRSPSAVDFSQKKDKAVVVGLSGDLGAGKTAFTKCIAKSFGIEDTVTSPTFVIEKIYELHGQKFSHLVHIDAYRLENGNELLNLGWNKIISDPSNIILIEWPERVSEVMPEHIKMNLKALEIEGNHEIEIVE